LENLTVSNKRDRAGDLLLENIEVKGSDHGLLPIGNHRF
jgi:hypothetical protein